MGLIYLLAHVSSPECSHSGVHSGNLAVETMTFIAYKCSLPLLKLIIETEPQGSNKDGKKRAFLVVIDVLHRWKLYW